MHTAVYSVTMNNVIFSGNSARLSSSLKDVLSISISNLYDILSLSNIEFHQISQASSNIVSIELDNNFNKSIYADKASNFTIQLSGITIGHCSFS